MELNILKDLNKAGIVADIHICTFPGFFLTFLGRGFLVELYKGFIEHDKSNVIVAVDNGEIIGFVAYSEDISAFYKYLIKTRVVDFAWYGFLAFLRKPRVMMRLLRAFAYSESSKREEKYVELSSIGVLPGSKNKGVGSMLMTKMKDMFIVSDFDYIKLETDSLNNDSVNAFYIKNGYELDNTFTTREGRKMNEYRYYLKKRRE